MTNPLAANGLVGRIAASVVTEPQLQEFYHVTGAGRLDDQLVVTVSPTPKRSGPRDGNVKVLTSDALYNVKPGDGNIQLEPRNPRSNPPLYLLDVIA